MINVLWRSEKKKPSSFWVNLKEVGGDAYGNFCLCLQSTSILTSITCFHPDIFLLSKCCPYSSYYFIQSLLFTPGAMITIRSNSEILKYFIHQLFNKYLRNTQGQTPHSG